MRILAVSQIHPSSACWCNLNLCLHSHSRIFFIYLPELMHLHIHSSVIRRRQWHPTPVLLPGKSHGQRSLVGCSPWGQEESDMTERLHFHFSLLCIGEGNGNPLQCPCLENPRDGVPQSQTRLQWLSSSSSVIWLSVISLSVWPGWFPYQLSSLLNK